MLFALFLTFSVATFIKPISAIILSLYQHFRTLNLKQVYGEGWAVITGATDGIGFGFCQVLASQGYNICLISRNRDKLEKKIQQLKEQFGNKVQYKAITADFKDSFKQGFFTNIENQLQEINPVILVNNVGISQITLLKEQSQSSIRDIISVNCFAQANLSSYFIKKCQQTNRKGGIINLSSYSWIVALPYMAIYAATKAYNDVLSRSCLKQTKIVDILSVRAMEVISSHVKKQKSISVCTSRQCAMDSLKYLGFTDVTAGHIKHEIIRHLTDALPSFLLQKIAINQAHRVYVTYGHYKLN